MTNAEARFNKIHIRKVYACLAVTCHLHFWHNDRDFLRATVVTRGWNGYRNKSQHRKSEAGFPQWRLFMFCENHATFTKMVCTNQSTIRSAPKTKNKRKQQLKNINMGMKRVTTASTPSQVTESSRVPVDVNHVLPVPVPSTSSSDNTLLGERTRTQFKRDSYKNVLSCEAGRRSTSSTSADGSASGDRDTRRGVVEFKEVGHLSDCLCCPVCKSSTLSLKTDTKKPQGLAVHAEVYCSSCEQVVSERYLASKRDFNFEVKNI